MNSSLRIFVCFTLWALIKPYMNRITDWVVDFSHLSFPVNCLGCNNALTSEEKGICSECVEHFPLTRYWEIPNNAVEKIFWGRINIERACSLMFFNKDGIAQRLMHKLKYEGKYEVGQMLGELFARKLIGTPFEKVDMVIPVPLHEKKRRQRGYNQCDFIAAGMASVFELSYQTNVVSRIRSNETQTNKGRYERWINVQELFRVHRPEVLVNKSVLLIDDVVTTGATLEACASALLDVEGLKVYVATIACPNPF